MIQEDLEIVRKEYPFIVTRLSYQSLELDLGNWICENVGDDMVIISKERQGPLQNFGPVLITYGFKHIEDATAFKIKFRSE